MPFTASSSPLPAPLSPARGPSLRARGAATAAFASASAPQARACTPSLLPTALRKPSSSLLRRQSPIGVRRPPAPPPPRTPQRQQRAPRRASSFATAAAAAKKSDAAATDLPEGASADIRVIAARAWKVCSSLEKRRRGRERREESFSLLPHRSPAPPPHIPPSIFSLIFAHDPSTPPIQKRQKNAQQQQTTPTSQLAKPYWTDPETGSSARWKLATVVGLTLGTTGVSVLFNFLGRDFFNALSEKDTARFTQMLFKWLGAIGAGVPVFVLRDYLQSRLALDWRQELTKRLTGDYLAGRAFYRVAAQGTVDNPDQWIAADVG